MSNPLVEEAVELAAEIDVDCEIGTFKSLQIAVKVQQNRILSDALALITKFQRTYKQSQQD